MESFYELFSDGETDYCYHYQVDHVDVYADGVYQYTRECSEHEVLSAWDSVKNL